MVHRSTSLWLVFTFLFGLFFSLNSFAYDHCQEDSKQCTFAVFPHSNFKQLLITYKSILEDLTLVLDTRVKLVSSRTMADFATKLDNKAFDIALIGPGQYVTHGQRAGYIPLARREGGLEIKLFVREDSDIKSYADLADKNVGIMLSDTTSWFAARFLLHKNGLSHTKFSHFAQGSQQACAHAIAIRQVEACFLAATNLETIQAQNVNVVFRSIGESIKIINPIYAVHPDMPKEVVSEIKDYLTSRENYISTSDSDFNEFRALVSKLEHL